MKTLPELDKDSVLRVSRQGGVAAIHSLSRPREIEFAQCDISQRSRICSVLEGCLPLDSTESGRGDQRFYQIEVRYQSGEMVLKVPEDRAPGELVSLWDKGELV
ncbi:MULTISPECIES: protealysin inhibitor emfourin [Pseudomonas]|uniref:protealysin inhibitor emfourin n=1 Tax=Pseudomonas TaxID=286 RepID=UPI00030E4572|nr:MULTISPECIES: protealysin inhibitor emfourin [Pseudomonas]